MKKVKIMLALVLALLLATTALPLMASASATDYELQEKFTIDFSSFPSSNWRFLTSGKMSIDGGRMKIPSARNSNENYGDRAFLVANAQSDDYRVVAGTDYVLKFDLWLDADEALSTKKVQLSFTPALWSNATAWVYGSSEKGGGATCDTLTIESQEEDGDYIVYRLAIPFTATVKSTMALSVFRNVSTAAGAAYYVDNVTLYEKVYAQAACTHENTTTTNTATYFKAGVETVVCDDCGETVSETAAEALNVALNGDFTETFADGKLTISWTYSDALALDILDGAKITFNYEIAGYKNAVELTGETGEAVILEGFNADRLNADLTYNLSAAYGDVDTAKLNAVGGTVKAADIANDEKLDTLLAALEADAVVNGKAENTQWLVSNIAKLDLKAAKAELNVAASQELIDALAAKGGRTDRAVKLIVKIGDDFTKEFEINDLRKYTIVTISGLSFEQLNGDISVRLVFDYANDEYDFAADEIVFACGDMIANADTAAANAFAAYMSK